jgi:hypothetical protein
MRYDGITRIDRPFVAITLFVALAWPGHAAAEWVKGDVRLNLRTGPGTDRRIIASVDTGDRVTVLDSVEGWTQVRIDDGRDGWVPAGYLANEPPPTVRLEQVEKELAEARERLGSVGGETEELRMANATLTSQNKGLTITNERLDLENRDLKAGARWPEWITGASILVMGMLMGAIMQAWQDRRSGGRVRLD